MRKLFLLLAITLFFNCSTDSNNEDDCNCTKETYRYDQYVVTGSNGLPRLTFDKVVLSLENISCNDEADQVSNGDDTYYDIVCE